MGDGRSPPWSPQRQQRHRRPSQRAQTVSSPAPHTLPFPSSRTNSPGGSSYITRRRGSATLCLLHPRGKWGGTPWLLCSSGAVAVTTSAWASTMTGVASTEESADMVGFGERLLSVVLGRGTRRQLIGVAGDVLKRRGRRGVEWVEGRRTGGEVKCESEGCREREREGSARRGL